MKNILLLVLVLSLAGCYGGSHNLFTSTLDPVVMTNVAGEYVIQARDLTPFTSSEKAAEENAIQGAIEYCSRNGQEFKKRYALTSPKAGHKLADATLFSRCVDMS
jgi:hypothetical protein